MLAVFIGFIITGIIAAFFVLIWLAGVILGSVIVAAPFAATYDVVKHAKESNKTP